MSCKKLFEIESLEKKVLDEFFLIFKDLFDYNLNKNFFQLNEIIKNQNKISLIPLYYNNFHVNKYHPGNGFGFEEKNFILDIPPDEIDSRCNSNNKICDKRYWRVFTYLYLDLINMENYKKDFVNEFTLDKTQNNYKSLIIDDDGVILGFYSPHLDIIGNDKTKNIYKNNNEFLIIKEKKIIKFFNNEVFEYDYDKNLIEGDKLGISNIELYLSFTIKILFNEINNQIEAIFLFCIPNGKLVPYYEREIEFSLNNHKVGALSPGTDNKNARFRYLNFKEFKLLDGSPLRIKILYWNENMDESLLYELNELKKIYDIQLDD